MSLNYATFQLCVQNRIFPGVTFYLGAIKINSVVPRGTEVRFRILAREEIARVLCC
jgi:hypothetical protein